MSITPFIQIKWQQGAISEFGENGCRPEEVIEQVIDRLLVFQAGPMACEENEAAIERLRAAVDVLEARVRRRSLQGVAHTPAADIPTATS